MTLRIPVLAGLAALFAASPAAGQQVAEVQLSPGSVTIAVNQQTGVLATAYDASGNVLPTAEFRWSSTNPSVVRVETDPAAPGLANLTGLAPGVAQVRVVAGSRTGVVQVQVLAVGGAVGAQVGTGTPTVLRIEPGSIQLLPGESRQLVPVFLKDDGSAAAPTPIIWQSLAAAIATVNDAGVVTGIAEGQGLIQLTNPAGLTATAPVEVTRAPIAFRIPVLSLSPEQEVTLEVLVPSQGGRQLSNTALNWRSTNESVVRVTPLGIARAQGAGEARIIVQGYLREDTLPVRVHRPVVSISVVPRRDLGDVMVPFGGHREFAVTAFAADESVVADAPMIWTVRDTTVAVFDVATNRLLGRTIGRTELHLRGPGPGVIEVTWPVNVVAGGLLISRQEVGLGIGDTVRLGASFTDMEGTPISPASSLTWTSGDPAVAAVTADGLVSAVGYGHARIVASTPWEAADTMDAWVQAGILVSSTRAGSPDLFAFDRDAPAALRRITEDPAAEASGAWSPDGARIAFASTRDGNQELYLVHPDGSDWVRLTNTPEVSEDGPAWTPDGLQIVYHAQQRGGRAQVWIMNADGSDPRPLTSGDATNFQPALSPDGGTIAYTSTREGSYDIWLMRLDGSEQRNVTQTPARDSRPEYFPDGTLGYIEEQRQGDRPVQVVVRKTLATGEVRPLTSPDLPVMDFAVAPSGTLLAIQTTAFGTQGGVQHRVYLVPLTGGQAVEVPREPGEQLLSPAFRPTRSIP